MPHTFIFFACPKKTNQKKGHFFKGIFATQNRNINSKLAPRFRQFLTNLYYYAVEKEIHPLSFFSSVGAAPKSSKIYSGLKSI
jgi:hypothetical protein